MDDSKVAVIILNWNGWEDTIECLESIYQINYSNLDVIVVDNDSEDESLERIRDYCLGKIKIKSAFFEFNPHNKPIDIREYTKKESESIRNEEFIESKSNRLTLIKNNQNYGFAEGNNIGIRYALKPLNPDYFLLLNNDTIGAKDFLENLVDVGGKNSDTGIIGPKIYYYDSPNVIWCIGGKIDWKFARGLHIGNKEADKGQYNEIREFDYVSGSAFLIKREVVDNIGLLDNQFFLYFEESDWALRACKKGYRSVYAPEAKVWHKISRSGGGISQPIGLYYITRNRWFFMKKWAKKSDYYIFKVYQAIGAVIIPIFLAMYYRNYKLFGAYYRGLWDGLNGRVNKNQI